MNLSSIIDKHAPFKQMKVSERYCLGVNADLNGFNSDKGQARKATAK